MTNGHWQSIGKTKDMTNGHWQSIGKTKDMTNGHWQSIVCLTYTLLICNFKSSPFNDKASNFLWCNLCWVNHQISTNCITMFIDTLHDQVSTEYI
jgi:cytochrome c